MITVIFILSVFLSVWYIACAISVYLLLKKNLPYNEFMGAYYSPSDTSLMSWYKEIEMKQHLDEHVTGFTLQRVVWSYAYVNKHFHITFVKVGPLYHKQVFSRKDLSELIQTFNTRMFS